MEITSDLKQELEQFIGSEQLYRHWLRLTYTDGIKYLAEKAQAYWLIDYIASAQPLKAVRCEPFQVWRLTVHADRKAEIAADDGNGKVIFNGKIPYTDFPLIEIKLYVADGTLLLPSEY